MRLRWRVPLIAVLTAVAVLAQAPRLESLEPDNGKPGDELVVKGQDLDSQFVADLFLTDGSNDHKVKMSEQTSELIRFSIPAKINPGRYRLMVLTKGPTPTYLEQPVFCTVNEQ